MNEKDIKIMTTDNPKEIPEEVHSFGRLFTDHLFIMDWEAEKGWYDPRIIPYGELSYSPAATIFHYGQGIFEGLKAYHCEDGNIRLFRPDCNIKRMNRSAERICMPSLDEDFALQALKKLVTFEKAWVPTQENTSLYIRPYMIGTQASLGVSASDHYQFIILLSPSGAYYKDGLAPVDIMVEKEYVRAVRGGLGEAKTLANYAASLLAGEEAYKKGYSQVLWLDGVERKYIEEVGSMNIMFVIDGVVVTPELNGSILPGITRQSVLELLRSKGISCEERRISIDELITCGREGRLQEIFGTGTAAVVSPVKKLNYDGEDIIAQSDYGEDSLSMQIYKALTDIQYGRVPDEHHWMVSLD